jgi:hypothetical protein
MKKLIVFFVFFFSVVLCFSQRDTLTIYKPEARELLTIVKQNTVYDTVNVQRKIRTIDNIQEALKLKSKQITVIVEREFVLDFLNRKAYDYEEYERLQKGRDSFLRVANSLYNRNKKLTMLSEERLADSKYYNLSQLRRKIIRDLKYENEVRFSIDGKELEDKEKLKIDQ